MRHSNPASYGMQLAPPCWLGIAHWPTCWFARFAADAHFCCIDLCCSGDAINPVMANVKQLQTLMAVSSVLHKRLKPSALEMCSSTRGYRNVHNAVYLIEPCFEYKFIGTWWDEGPSPPYPRCWNSSCNQNALIYTAMVRMTAIKMGYF